MKRILFLAPQPFFSQRGTTIAELEAVRVLCGRGYEVDLLTYSGGEDVEVEGCTIHRIPRIPLVRRVRPGFSLSKLVSDLVMAVRAAGLVRRRRPDLVHAVEESVFIAAALRRIYGVPYVYDMDSSLPRQLVQQMPPVRLVLPLLARLERRAVRESLAVLTMCRSLEDLARSHAPDALVGRVEDMAMVDGVEGVERLRDRVGDGPIVLYVGNLMPYQGVELLLKAFALAVREAPSAQLVVIGGAESRLERYGERVAAAGLAERVHLLGPRPLAQLGWYLRQATVLVSPRVHGTNTPMKLYSYLDSGVPVLATRLLTHTQVVDDSQAELCDPTPGAMAAGLTRLLSDPERRRVLAENARALVAREFTRESHHRKLNRFYDAVEARRNGDGPPPAAPSAGAGEGRAGG